MNSGSVLQIVSFRELNLKYTTIEMLKQVHLLGLTFKMNLFSFNNSCAVLTWNADKQI